MSYYNFVALVLLATLLVVASGMVVVLKSNLQKAKTGEEKLKGMNADLQCKNASLTSSLSEQKKYSENCEAQLESLRKSYMNAESSRAAMEVEKSHLQSEISKNKEHLETVQKVMNANFQELSTKIFREQSAAFSEISKDKIHSLVSPIRDDIKNFQSLINSAFGKQAEDKSKLEGIIKQLIVHTTEMGNKAEKLASSLQNNISMQGVWGEIVLEKVLEGSGLRKGTEYVIQQHKKVEAISSENSQYQTVIPDVIINLPNSKQLIIDAKLPMKSYMDFVNACKSGTESGKNELISFIQTMRRHIKALSTKCYQNIENSRTTDFIFLFIPIESAYATIIDKDRDIHRFAAENNIFLVSPTTLMSVLQTVATVWRTEKQNLNSEQISKLGGYIYDKVATFLQDMQKLKESMDKADACYDSAIKKLSSGRGSIMKKSYELKLLGAKVSKDMPDNASLSYANEQEEA